MLDEFRPRPGQKYALVFGNEVDGVAQEVVDAADRAIEIPQAGTKHSVNVSVAEESFCGTFLASPAKTLELPGLPVGKGGIPGGFPIRKLKIYNAMSVESTVRAVTTYRLWEMKQRREKIAMLTSYGIRWPASWMRRGSM